MNTNDNQTLFPIREVSRLTGVNPITLRAWERRYELIEPIRTESGHRLYNQEHIDILQQAIKMVESGTQIGRVKSLLAEQPLAPVPKPTATEQLLVDIQQAFEQFHLNQINFLLDRLFADYPIKVLLQNLVSLDEKLKAQPFALAYWQSQINQRLNVRLHHTQLARQTASKRVYIHLAPSNPVWLNKLLAQFCFDQGYYPIFVDRVLALEQVMDFIKPLNINAVMFIDLFGGLELEWQIWFKQYAGLKTWILGDSTVENLNPPSINCELRAWPNWLKPL